MIETPPVACEEKLRRTGTNNQPWIAEMAKDTRMWVKADHTSVKGFCWLVMLHCSDHPRMVILNAFQTRLATVHAGWNDFFL